MKSRFLLFIFFATTIVNSCALVDEITEEERIDSRKNEVESIITKEINNSFPDNTYVPLKYSNYRLSKSDKTEYAELDHLFKLENDTSDNVTVAKFHYKLIDDTIKRVIPYYLLDLTKEEYEDLLYFYKRKTLPLRGDSFNDYANKDFYNKLYYEYQLSKDKGKYLQKVIKIIQYVKSNRKYDLEAICAQIVSRSIIESNLYTNYEALNFSNFYDLVEYNSTQLQYIREIENLKKMDSVGYANQIMVLENLIAEEGEPLIMGYHIDHKFQSEIDGEIKTFQFEYILSEYLEIEKVIPISQ